MHHLEVERKYELDEGTLLAPVGEWAFPTLQAEPPVQEHLDATYFETAQGDLGRQGVALRRRMGGYDQGWHIKFDAAGARHEVTFDLLKSPSTMPAAVRKFVQTVTLGAALEPRVSLVTERVRTVLRDAQGRAVAELCEDRVQARDYLTGIERSWQELEVELLDEASGDSALGEAIFEEVEALVFEQGARVSHSSAKIARALGLDPDFEARRLGGGKEAKKVKQAEKPKKEKKGKKKKQAPAPQAVDLLAKALGAHVAALAQTDLLVKADAPDSTHRARVAARQLRSLIRYALLPYAVSDEVKDQLRQLARGLRQHASILEAHRNCELLGQMLGERSLPTGLGAESLEAALEADSRKGGQAARRYLDSAERYELQQKLADLLVNLPQMLEVPEQADVYIRSVAKSLRKALKKDLRVVAQGADSLEAGDEALHDARKTAKATRYVLSALSDLGLVEDGRARDLLGLAQGIQSASGQLTDELTLAAWLVAQRPATAQEGLALGYLLGQSEQRASYLRQDLVQGSGHWLLALKGLKF